MVKSSQPLTISLPNEEVVVRKGRPFINKWEIEILSLLRLIFFRDALIPLLSPIGDSTNVVVGQLIKHCRELLEMEKDSVVRYLSAGGYM